MKVFKILASDYVIGVVVNDSGNMGPDEALAAWNAQGGNYQGDTAETVAAIKA